MTVKERIKQFEKENAPFTLYEHDNGRYSLGLRFSFFTGRYENYGQEAFNDYALQAGEPVKDGQFFTHGNGYEWEDVFCKAFEQDERLLQIDMDSEAGSFFCVADDLSLLEEFGSRFRAMCEDKEGFSRLVCQALAEAEQESIFHQENQTIKWHIDGASRWSMEIITPEYHLHLAEGQGVDLLKGRNITATDSISGEAVEVNAKDLLRYRVTESEYDRENDSLTLKAEPVQSEDLTASMTM